MAGLGRLRTPTATLVARGAIRGKQRAKTEAKLPPSSIDAPVELSGVALAKWQELAPCLVTSGVMTMPDRDALMAYCNTWAAYLELEAAVKVEGWTIATEKMTYKNPKAAMLQDTRNAMIRLMQELGITPATRSRVVVKKEPSKEDTILKYVRAK